MFEMRGLDFPSNVIDQTFALFSREFVRRERMSMSMQVGFGSKGAAKPQEFSRNYWVPHEPREEERGKI